MRYTALLDGYVARHVQTGEYLYLYPAAGKGRDLSWEWVRIPEQATLFHLHPEKRWSIPASVYDAIVLIPASFEIRADLDLLGYKP